MRNGGKDAELLLEGAAARTRIRSGESRVRAQVSTRVKPRFGRGVEEIHIVADFPDVAGDSGSETILPASACSSGIVATHHRRKRKLMSSVLDRIVMERPDHDVSVQTGETDEEGSRALVLKARDVDAYFVESEIVWLACDILRAERTTDHRGVRGEEPHVVDRFEVALSFNAVSDLNRSEAPRVGDYQISRPVGGWTKQITGSSGGALCRESLSRVGVTVEIEN